MRVFQSLRGRLKTALMVYCWQGAYKFQSLRGRLKTGVDRLGICAIIQFQSLRGRLKTVFASTIHAMYECFNPSEVG